MNSTVASFQCDFVKCSLLSLSWVWMPGLGCPELDVRGWWRCPAEMGSALPAAASKQSLPRQGNSPKGLGCTNRAEHEAPLTDPPAQCAFNKAGLHRVPAVPLTGDAAPWPWGTAAPQRPGSSRAQAQGTVLGPQTQCGFAQSQMAVALGKTLFPDGHQGWPVNLPSKENGDFSANSLAGPAAVFPPVCPLLPWQLTHHSIANSTEMGSEQNEASHTMFSCCCRAGCGTRREQHQGQCWRTHPGPSAAARADEGPRLYKPLHAGTRHWGALNTFSIAHRVYTYMGIYVYMEVWLQNCTKGVMRLWGGKAWNDQILQQKVFPVVSLAVDGY